MALEAACGWRAIVVRLADIGGTGCIDPWLGASWSAWLVAVIVLAAIITLIRLWRRALARARAAEAQAQAAEDLCNDAGEDRRRLLDERDSLEGSRESDRWKQLSKLSRTPKKTLAAKGGGLDVEGRENPPARAKSEGPQLVPEGSCKNYRSLPRSKRKCSPVPNSPLRNRDRIDVVRWAEENLIPRPGSAAQAASLFDHYVGWAGLRGIAPVSATMFGTIIGELHSKEKRGGFIHYRDVAVRGDRSSIGAVP